MLHNFTDRIGEAFALHAIEHHVTYRNNSSTGHSGRIGGKVASVETALGHEVRK